MMTLLDQQLKKKVMSNRMKIPKVCQHCGKTFIAQTTVTKFCGDTCAKRNYKKRAKDAKIELALNETMSHVKGLSNPTPASSKEYLCINDVSSLLGVSRWTIQRMVQKGDLSVKQVGRKKLLSRQQLDTFFQ